MRVEEISGKDVHNIKERGPNSVGQGRQIQDLRGGRGSRASRVV